MGVGVWGSVGAGVRGFGDVAASGEWSWNGTWGGGVVQGRS